MQLILTRTYHNEGTNGIISTDQQANICFTIELPWLNNQPRVSCIPEGTYRITMRYSQKFGLHMLLADVANRSTILVHPANNAMQELKGCIAPVTKLTGPGKGTQSRMAFEKLKTIVRKALETAPVFLTIKSI